MCALSVQQFTGFQHWKVNYADIRTYWFQACAYTAPSISYLVSYLVKETFEPLG